MARSPKLEQRILTSEDFAEIFGNRFKIEWDGETTIIPYSEALRKRGGPIMATALPSVPGSLNGDSILVAFMAIMNLESALNDQIDVVNYNFSILKQIQTLHAQGKFNPHQDDIFGRYRTSIEILAYIMKTTIDKIICAISISKYGYADNGGIRHDCIGSLLDRGAREDTTSNKTVEFADGVFVDHYKFLFRINDIHNAYKHTFSTTQINTVDTITPTMATVYKPQNSTRHASRIAFMLCYEAVQSFEKLITSSKNYLSSLK